MLIRISCSLIIFMLFLLEENQLKAQYFYKPIDLLTRTVNGSVENSTNALQLQNGEYLVGRHSFRPQQAYVGPGGTLITIDLFTAGVIKYNTTGAQQWVKPFKTTSNTTCLIGDENDDNLSSKSIQLQDGKLLTVSNFLNFNVYHNHSGSYVNGFSFIKTDPANGNTISSKTFDFGCDYGRRSTIVTDLKEDKKRNVYLTGYTNEYGAPKNCFLIKLGPKLNQLWSVIYQSGVTDIEGRSIAFNEANDHVYVGGAMISSKGDKDAFVLCAYPQDGSLYWVKEYGGAKDDELNVIQPSLDNELVFLGTSRSFGFNNNYSDFWFTKIDMDGNLIWSNTYGSDNDDEGIDMTGVAVLKQYVLGGNTNNSGGGDVQLVWVTSAGSVKEGRLYGSVNKESLFNIQKTIDNGLLFWGHSGSSTGTLYKTNSNGIIPKAIGCTSAKNLPVQIAARPSVRLPLITEIHNTATARTLYDLNFSVSVPDNTYCLNTTSTNALEPVATTEVNNHTIFTIRQSANNNSVISFSKNYRQGYYSLYTLSGQLLQHKKLDGRLVESLSLEKFSTGIYLLTVTVDYKTTVQKIVKN